MKNMSLENIAAACGGRYYGDENKKKQIVTSITTDSRKSENGCLFVAIKGERVDGHDFVSQVYREGALCVLSERELTGDELGGSYILVESSLQAVKDIAEFYRQQLDVKVVGITGSVGKTSTKEMIASVLSEKYNVLKTIGNFNNELGLPLTIFRLREEHEIAVLEMGISDFGEMHRLSKIARPDICVITNIGQCHLEFLKSRDGILKAKSEIFDFIAGDGSIVLNGDDDKLAGISSVKGIRPVFFGIESGREIYADNIESRGLSGIQCTIHVCEEKSEESFTVLIPIPGRHMVLNAMAGTAVGRLLGLDLEEIRNGIGKLESLKGRFHIIEHAGRTIVDDCYNASPAAMKASLDVLSEAQGRRVAILGDMFELGEDSALLHAGVGEHASDNRIDLLICVGDMCRHMAEAAFNSGGCREVLQVPTLEALLQTLPKLTEEGDTILVKASHGMHFEKVIEKLQEL
ncbi:UDP-N-acetylmuramoyl-tripeptide--D-alanyl-D-alanine ligase [Murimonas intestini]|uniref:UDP-N-acetylmuramoyl-tripeptide--D-alanyl-D- alanine ligase n=1 Tax=Murimonas intestini TaxID=1337051 RepID=UPI0011DC788E|nr:UDP-N-acetylmuramoyl-tripeptide--D-alanyl-D-alanine ligase [Murimonas intestini]